MVEVVGVGLETALDLDAQGAVEDLHLAGMAVQLVEEQLEDLLPSPEAGPEALYVRNVLLDALESAVDELPEEQRKVFVAHELGYSEWPVEVRRRLEKLRTLGEL